MASFFGRLARTGHLSALILIVTTWTALAAPYAGLVMDARTGEILHSENADTRLHPASLTKMMTLYIAFEAIERGEISVDTKVTISRNAAAEPPSKLGLRAGQKIALRYLIRAAAIKSANDAATAIGEAISGSEAAFAERMTRTARALGMERTTFKNAHGLTASGHMSTARDMSMLGRRLLFDYPKYYNLFSRRTANAGISEVRSTNRRFLAAYRGADGIKTGFTNAAGFNLVASAERDGTRIIATVFGGRSTASRNAQVAKLLDLGFRSAPSRVAVAKPAPPDYESVPAGKVLRVSGAVLTSPRPAARPLSATLTAEVVADVQETVERTLALVDLDAATAPLVGGGVEPLIDIAPAIAEAVGEAVGEAVAGAVEVAALAQSADADAEVAAGPGPDPESATLTSIGEAPTATEAPAPTGTVLSARAGRAPLPRPRELALAASVVADTPDGGPASVSDAAVETEIVTRLSTDGTRQWGISVGKFGSRFQAERVLLETALLELGTLDQALRKVVPRSGGYQANFVGMSEGQADLACARLNARNRDCTTMEPG